MKKNRSTIMRKEIQFKNKNSTLHTTLHQQFKHPFQIQQSSIININQSSIHCSLHVIHKISGAFRSGRLE